MSHPQFTLRALLVIMLAVAVCSAVLASFWSAAVSLGVVAIVIISWRSDWAPFFPVRARKDDD